MRRAISAPVRGRSCIRPGQLVVPEVNLTLGSRYLRELLSQYGGALVPALIAYNAGPHRYAAWRSFPEFSADRRLMIDRIPFGETRRYVKALIVNRYVYDRLYYRRDPPRADTRPGASDGG
jgi:soluble lytic murein transglycosylase